VCGCVAWVHSLTRTLAVRHRGKFVRGGHDPDVAEKEHRSQDPQDRWHMLLQLEHAEGVPHRVHVRSSAKHLAAGRLHPMGEVRILRRRCQAQLLWRRGRTQPYTEIEKE
jgi:hypothetical protein